MIGFRGRVRTGAARLAGLCVCSGLVACATSYVSPDPGASPTARIAVQNQGTRGPRFPFSTPSIYSGPGMVYSTTLDIYAADGPCDPTTGDMKDVYRGGINLNEFDVEFRVVAEHPVFFRLSHSEGTVSFRSKLIGFVPHADQTYTLEVIDSIPGAWGADVKQGDASVDAVSPSSCFASGW